MDDRLRLIRYLYGEESDESGLERRLLDDDSLRQEFERLRHTKQHLDQRPPQRPDADVVDEVVQEARMAAESSESALGWAADREPNAPRRTWSRRLQAVSAALVLLLVIGLGWWRLPTGEAPSQNTAVQEAASADPSISSAQPGDGEVPSWDDSEDLIRIHRNLERVQARSAPDQWGTLQTIGQTQP